MILRLQVFDVSDTRGRADEDPERLSQGLVGPSRRGRAPEGGAASGPGDRGIGME